MEVQFIMQEVCIFLQIRAGGCLRFHATLLPCCFHKSPDLILKHEAFTGIGKFLDIQHGRMLNYLILNVMSSPFFFFTIVESKKMSLTCIFDKHFSAKYFFFNTVVNQSPLNYNQQMINFEKWGLWLKTFCSSIL